MLRGIQGGALNQYGDAAPPGSQVFSGFLPSTAADVSRGNTGAYLDLETNFTKELLVNGAARFENYTDFGSKLSSKLALRYQPAKEVVFRGAVSTGFRAPSLAQSYYGSRITNFVCQVIRPSTEGIHVVEVLMQSFGEQP